MRGEKGILEGVSGACVVKLKAADASAKGFSRAGMCTLFSGAAERGCASASEELRGVRLLTRAAKEGFGGGSGGGVEVLERGVGEESRSKVGVRVILRVSIISSSKESLCTRDEKEVGIGRGGGGGNGSVDYQNAESKRGTS